MSQIILILFSFLWISSNIMLKIDCIKNIELGALSRGAFLSFIIASTIALINHFYRIEYISSMKYSDVVNWRFNMFIKSMTILSIFLMLVSGCIKFIYTKTITTTDVFEFIGQPGTMIILANLININNMCAK